MTINQIAIDVLTEREFDSCPLWKSSEDIDGYCAVRGVDDLPDLSQDLLIKADFFSPSNVHYKGYIVGISNVVSIGLFVRGRKFRFNSNLVDLSEEQLETMRQMLAMASGMADEAIFPLRFTTTFSLPGYANFSGVFDLYKAT